MTARSAFPHAIRPAVGWAGLATVLFCYSALAADPYDTARRDYPDLFQVYYDRGLLDYCGLQTAESMGGFALRRDELLAKTPLSADQHRTVRIAAGIRIDYDYQDHGLSGSRTWCRTAGRAAYDRFVARYRAQNGDYQKPHKTEAP
jgi:hypothetical protein